MTPPRRRYPTDLTDAQWALLAPLIPAPKPGGRPAVHDRRELVNAMLYLLRSGCAWRLLPHDFPPWQTVYHYWRAWRRQGVWERVLGGLRVQERTRQGRKPTPSAGILDSQSVRTTEKMTCAGTPSGSGTDDRAAATWASSKEVPVSIIGGLDVHRRQITYDWIDTDTGQTRQGQLAPASREHLRVWLEPFAGQQVAFALEGCTGWRYVVEELQLAGITAHLAEPADTRALRGRKRHAKTDRADARHLRDLLMGGRLPESWIPPAHVLEARTQVRLYKALVDQRTAWQQRIHAVLFHHGVPAESDLLVAERRQRLTQGAGLTVAAHQAVLLALRMIDAIDAELDLLRAELAHLARRQPGCAALRDLYGVGPITAVAIWAEFGDVRRFSSSRHAVRHTGLDVTVYASDDKRAPGHLARQGPAVLRWALFEAAQCAARASAPDHAYYTQVKARLGGNRAALSVARKLARRAYHLLRGLGDDALAPVAGSDQPAAAVA